MSDIEIHESEELTLPHSAELVNLEDPLACANALSEIRELENRFREVKAILTRALVAESERQGSKTLHLENGIKAVVGASEKIVYDAHALEEGLRAAGCPEARLDTIIRTEITYAVVAGEAKRAAGANPEYKKVVEACSTVLEVSPTVSISKGAVV